MDLNNVYIRVDWRLESIFLVFGYLYNLFVFKIIIEFEFFLIMISVGINLELIRFRKIK